MSDTPIKPRQNPAYRRSVKKFLSAFAFQEDEQPMHAGQEFNPSKLGLYSIAEYLPYESFDEQTDIYHCKHAKGIVMETEPMSGASHHHMQTLYGFLQRTLPEGVILHCLLYASPHIGEDLDAYVNAHQPASLAKTLAEKRAAFWRKGAFKSLVPGQNSVLRHYKLLITLVFDNQLEMTDSQISALKETLKGVLRSLNLSGRFLAPTALLQWADALLRPNQSLYPQQLYYNELDSLSTLLAASHYCKRILRDKILLDEDWQITNFRVEDYGRTSPHLAQMSDLLGSLLEPGAQIGCPFSLSFIIQIAHSAQENFKANYLARRALQRAEKIGKFSPKSIQDANEARLMVSEIENFERLALISFQVSLYCKHEDAAHHESSLLNVFQSAEFKWRLVKNHFLQAVMLLAHLPLGQHAGLMRDLQKLGLLYKVWTKNAAGMLPMVAETHGMQSRGFMLAGRRGQIFFWDLFGNNRGNHNTCVVGISGSGKSVTVQEITRSLIGAGGKTFIIDVGRSYQKLCEAFEGQFIAFQAKTPIGLNPFPMVKSDDDEEVNDFLSFMTPFISAMVGGAGSPMETAFIAKAVKAVWQEKGNQGCMSDIAHWLLAQPDNRAQDLGTVLYPYTREGQYGPYFNHVSAIDFTASIVVFELEEISSDKRLQSIVFMLLMYHVTHKMYLGERKLKISLIVDEAWDLLKGGQGGDIIENIARRARKYKGALITITQSLADYFASPAGQAAYKNAYWKLIHMQEASDITMCSEEGKIILTPFQKRLALSLQTENGLYSEMMVLGNAGECALGRLYLDPFSNLLYSTQPKDFEAINRLRQQGVPLIEALDIVSQRH